ncbi:unnamed protein product [Clavelina lepadiformis]|uniref:Uncharacterized protein n=1 Tax=Clavelina lepadiformis TaxID=159417 RepID=A0ABP0GX94_CLALP
MSISTKESKFVLLERHKGYAVIRLNRPERKNGIVQEMEIALSYYLDTLANDDTIKLVVITGTGEYYTSGADIIGSFGSDERSSEKNDVEKIRKRLEPFKNLVNSFIRFPKPIIAAVNGPAIGMGVTTLPLCDVVYAAADSTFMTPFSKIAMIPEACSSYTFPIIMGYSMANEMLLFNRKITAEEAYRFGLISRIFPKETFMTEVEKKVEEFLDNPAKCLEFGKKLIRDRDREKLHKINEEEVEQLVERLQSEDTVTQAIKFLEERQRIKRERARKARL